MSDTSLLDTELSTSAAVVVPFSDAMAGYYDLLYPDFESDAVIAFLDAIGQPKGTVLEVGIGTGRLGLPLAQHGYEVHGVEASTKMLEVLRAKPGADRLAITEGDFVSLHLGRVVDVVLAPFNVLCCALTPEAQIGMLTAMARHLGPDGVAVIETFDPTAHHIRSDAVTNMYPIGDTGVLVENMRTLPAEQLMVVVNSLFLTDAAPKVSTLAMRYVWPSELDVLAGVAGMELVARYGGWDRRPFTGADGRQMSTSVYRLSR